MKAMKFRAVLLALLLAGMAMVPCVSAAAAVNENGGPVPISVANSDVKEFYSDMEFVTWDPLLERETPYYMLLVLNSDGKADSVNKLL